MQNFSLPVYTLKTWKFENIHSMTVKFCMHRKKISLTGSGGNFLKFSIFIMNDPLLSGAKPHLWKNSHVNPSLTFFFFEKCHHEINAKACVPNGVFFFLRFLGSGSSRGATSLGRGLFSLQWSDIFIPLWSFISLLWGGSSSAAVQLWTLLLIAEIKIKTVCQL